MLTSTPKNMAPRAAPSEWVLAWTWEPTHSHSTGTPTQSTIPPPSMIRIRSSPLPPVRSRFLIRRWTLPEPEPAGAPLEQPAQPEERGREHDDGGARQQPDRARPGCQHDRGDRDEGGEPRQQRGVRAKAGQVLSQRELEAPQRGQRDPDGEPDLPAPLPVHESPDHQHDADQDHQLHEREVAPGGGRALLGPRPGAGAAPRRGPAGRRRAGPLLARGVALGAGAGQGGGRTLARAASHQRVVRWLTDSRRKYGRATS